MPRFFSIVQGHYRSITQNAGYARQIAEEWNTKSDTYSGYVTRFNIDNDYCQKFKREIVGGKKHEELWIPAEELAEFNQNIVGHIEVLSAYFGSGFTGSKPVRGTSDNTVTADKYLQMLMATLEYNYMDFIAAIILNYRSVFCNYAYWKQFDISRLEYKSEARASQLISAIAECWHSNFPGVKLPTEAEILEYEAEDLA